MLQALRGKGLFVFSDPGGAKPLLALADSLSGQLSDYKIISDRKYFFYDNFSSVVEPAAGLAYDLLKSFAPDFLFTGTSYTSKIELEYIKAANELEIRSYAFVDHWTSIHERFIDNETEVLPDTILVLDARAKQIGIDQGIPEWKMQVFENPYHIFLKKWKPVVSRDSFLRSIGVQDQSNKIIVFAPDPLSNINGKSRFGFDEVMATKVLKRISENIGDRYLFLLNPHPNQNLELLQNEIGGNIRLIPAGTDVNSLIYYSDVVIGFFSNLLIEAEIMQKKVFRFFDHPIDNDPLENNVGKIVYPDTIQSALKNI